MNQARINLLEQYVQEQPDEPFNHYALAMEYVAGDPAQALHYLEILLTRHPDYLPTYYQAATLYAEGEDRERARTTFERGLELASSQGNQKTYDELSRAYRAFEDEDW